MEKILDPVVRERFILQLGEALHRLGTPADALEETLGGLCRRMGLEAQVLITPTSITACFGAAGQGRMHLVRCNQKSVDLGKLSELARIADAVIRDSLPAEAALVRINGILCKKNKYPDIVTLLAFALASASVARVLGGGIDEIFASCLIGFAMGLLDRAAQKMSTFARLFAFVAPCVSAACALALTELLGPYEVRLTTLAGLIIFLPGMATMTALTELSTGHLVAGTSRLMGAMVTFLQLGLGVLLGTRAAQLLLTVQPITVRHAPEWTQWVALGIAAVSIAMILQAELRDLVWILLCALSGFLGLHAGGQLLGPEFAPCCAAFCVTLFSNVYGRVLRRTPSVTQVPAMLLLVPGTVGFRSVAALMQNDVLGGMQAAFTMGLNAMALVAGALLAGLFFIARKDA